MSESVPNGWGFYPLANVLKDVKTKNKSNDNYPVLSVTKYNGFVRSDSYFKKQVFSRDLTTYRVVSEGQFAYATIHLDEGSLGLLKGVEKGLVSPMYTVFDTTDTIDSVFLFYLLKSDYFMHLYPSLGQGSIDRRASIPFKVLSAVRFLSPPLSEQKKIASILTSVDEVIEKTQAQIDKLKDLKTGMLQELLTRGVGVDGKPHTVFKNSPVGRIPAEWDVVKLSSVLSKIDSGWSPACIEMPPATAEWGVVKVSAVTRGRFLEKESKTLPKELKPKPHIQIKRGDILLTRANGAADLVGKCVMVSSEPKAKLMMSDKILRLNVNDKVHSKFLLHYFNSRQIRKQIELSWGGSSGQKNISQADIKGYFIALPRLNEQMIIGDSISQIDTLLSVREAKLRKLEDSKKALMQDLLTGKKRVKVDC